MFKRLFDYLSRPKQLTITNAILVGLVIAGNVYIQVMCIPSTWAAIVLAICFLNLILFPLLKNHKRISLPMSFINGVACFTFIYCIIFFEHTNVWALFMIIFFGIGFLTYIPYYFVIQLVWANMVKPVSRFSKWAFLAGFIVCIGISISAGYQYKQAIIDIEAFKESDHTELNKTFMTEKILGMHFIYHTRFCEYDGWRPPKHEPLLVLGMWLNGREDPLHVSLETRLGLYKQFFPNRPYKFDCSCAMEYSEVYYNDILWK